ncbi:EpsG family protein [Bacillus sp. OTU2372]|uniref:EpsG family protein n=1 Tax=Bacillus sp. OTU2372 TaxID=3043858 RepID=UPI00313C16DB
MQIYIYLILLIILIGIYTDQDIIQIQDRIVINPNVYLLFSCLVLFSFSALRHGIGTDYVLYNGIYLSGVERELNLGWLFSSISDLSRKLHINYQWFLAFNALLYMSAVYLLIRLFSPYKYISLLILLGSYSFFSSMNTFRQFSSISLVIFALVLFYKYKKIYLSILIYILAIAMHNSSLLFAPLFLLNIIKFETKGYLIILGICFLSFFGLPDSLKSEIFTSVLKLNSFFYEKYSSSELSIFAEGAERGLNNRLFYLFYWIVTFVYIFRKSKLNENIDWIDKIFLFYFLFNSFMPFSTLVERLSYLFDLFSIIIFPRFINIQETDFNKNIFKVVIALIFIFRMISVLLKNGDGVVPYSSILLIF